MSQSHMFVQVDPRTVEVGPNVRLDPRLDQPFLASVRERGVLEPVLLYRAEDGTLTVLAGQRRTLAARETGLASIPAVVSDTPPADADRLVDQYVENEHRAALTNSERITAVEQMALAGLSEHQIAKRTGTDKATIHAAKVAASSPASREAADQLTLDQAATLAEFDDDPQAVATLLSAAERGYGFDHAAQRLRNDRAETAARAALALELTAQGVTVIDRPGYDDPATPLDHLTDPAGNPITPDGHTTCPGHAAFVAYQWHYTTPDDDPTDQDADDDDLADGEDEGDGGVGWSAPTREQVLAATYVCTDPDRHGHRPCPGYGPRTSSGVPEKKRAADMTDTERETARAERRRVIESNKAWKAATDVRRDWLQTFATRKTAPAGAETYLAQAVVQGWTADPASTDTLALVGHPAPDDVTPWTRATTQATALLATLEGASPKRALQVAVAVTVATWEVRTQPQSWRNPDPHTVATLRYLQQWGYQLSEIEQQMITDQ